jgi:hypothetical protein
VTQAIDSVSGVLPRVTDHTQVQDQGELFPVPGDVLEQGFIRWKVVDREPAHVLFVVEGMNEPPRRVSLRQWQRVAARAASVSRATT